MKSGTGLKSSCWCLPSCLLEFEKEGVFGKRLFFLMLQEEFLSWLFSLSNCSKHLNCFLFTGY